MSSSSEPPPPPASTTSPSPPIVSPLPSVSSFASPSSPPEPTLLDAPTIANFTSTETPARLHLAADILVSNPASAIPTPEGMAQLLHELATLRAQVNAQQPSTSTSIMQQSATNRPAPPSRYDLPEARPRPRPRIPTPDPFSGDSGQDLETFLASLEIFFTINDLDQNRASLREFYLEWTRLTAASDYGDRALVDLFFKALDPQTSTRFRGHATPTTREGLRHLVDRVCNIGRDERHRASTTTTRSTSSRPDYTSSSYDALRNAPRPYQPSI
ncbi:hypothetical protein RI367_007847 [Sorochytrium milnesiophthora]